MSAYDSVFYAIPYNVCVLAAIVLLSLALQKHALVARSIVFIFQFWIAPLFYFTYMSIVHRVFPVVVIAGCLEFLFMAIYLILFKRLFVAVTTVSPQFLSKMLGYLKAGTWILILLSAYLFLQPGAGIFSVGSRIEYLADSRLNLYLDEASALIQLAMMPVVAAVINNTKRWNKLVVFYLITISIISVLSGSKGNVLLSMLSIASLLKFDRARDYIRVLWGPICCIAALFTITVFVVGQFLLLEPSQMIATMYDRLFLANDARALAIDWSSNLGADGTSLFSESFRNVATLIGSPPKHPPLGQFLYSLQFSTVGLQGGNTSSTALLIAYGRDIEKILFTIVIAITAVVTGLITEIPGHSEVLRLSIGIYFLSLLSQDLLAFELFMNILLFMIAAVLVKSAFTKIFKTGVRYRSVIAQSP